MVVSEGNVKTKSTLKFDPLHRDLLCSTSANQRPNKPSVMPKKEFSIDQTWYEIKSRKSNPVRTQSSVQKYFPHLGKSVELQRDKSITLEENNIWWRGTPPQSRSKVRTSRYHRSTTAPPRLNRSFEDDSIDLNAIDLVSIANEQEYQSMSTERHRCVNRTLRCHSAKTMCPDIATSSNIDPGIDPCYYSEIIRRKPCVRESSVMRQRTSNKMNALSMEWCDVLGPKHCFNCDKVHKRKYYGAWNESNYETIGINTENLSALTLVERLLPDMDSRDIQHNIADGNIARGELNREKLSERRKSTIDMEESQPPAASRRRRISAFGVPDGLGFFLNFSDLRSQIMEEEKKKKARKGVKFDVTEYITIPSAEVDIEVVDNKDKHYANYFAPPLLSRSAVGPPPSFYAGSDSSYQLPRAPTITHLRQRASDAMVEMEAASVVKFGGIDDGNNGKQNDVTESADDPQSS
ncbi:uncharacterized protein [Antedon mediterranea]